MEIPDIDTGGIQINNVGIRNIDIPNVYVSDWLIQNPPMALPIYPPVTSVVGTPVVNMPGCVEAHQESNKNTALKDEDPDGTRVYCDAGSPSFYPIDYDASRLELTQPDQKPPPIKPPEAPETETPETPAVPNTGDTGSVECPTRAQELKEPVGHIKGDLKVTGYELVGKECIQVTEKIEVVEQIIGNIPSAGAVTATASIAVVATSSAILAKPLADMLLKVVKPVVKKVIKKVQGLLGKTPPKLSSAEIRADKYREKKGLPPIKWHKKKKKD